MSTNPEVPELRNPWMIAAFEGWNDAGDAASGVVDHLLDEWDAEILTELDPEDYYDFQMNRPHIGTDEEGERFIHWPSTVIYFARPKNSDRDMVLVRGLEPNFRWLQYCSTIIGLGELVGVSTLVTLGALLADTPHTRPVPITGSTSDPLLGGRLELEPSRYTGPIGINSVLAENAAAHGISTLSLWAAVPHYLAEPPCPKATLALLGRLEDAMGIPLPQGVLAEMTEAWQRGAEDLSEKDEEIAEYVQALESERETSELPEASGDAIAREFERYLRRRSTDPEA